MIRVGDWVKVVNNDTNYLRLGTLCKVEAVLSDDSFMVRGVLVAGRGDVIQHVYKRNIKELR